MIYKCKNCNYQTDIKARFIHHNESVKHIKNTTSQQDATDNTSLVVHKLSKKINKLSIEKKLIKVQTELEFEKKLAREKDNIRLDHTNYLKGLVTQAGNIVTTSISTLSFLKTNYTTAPLLMPLPNFNNLMDKNEKAPLEDVLIHNFKYKKLEDFVCGILVNHYKKQNPREQSAWNTDPERRTYIVRSLVNNEPEWVTDKKGEKLKALAVDPLVEYLRSLIDKRMQLVMKTVNSPIKVAKMELLSGLIKTLDDSKFGYNIIGKMATHLYLDQTKRLTGPDQVTKPMENPNDEPHNPRVIEKLNIKDLDISESIVDEIMIAIDENSNNIKEKPEEIDIDDPGIDFRRILPNEKPARKGRIIRTF